MNILKETIKQFAKKERKEGIELLLERSKDMRYEIEGKDCSTLFRAFVCATAIRLEEEGEI